MKAVSNEIMNMLSELSKDCIYLISAYTQDDKYVFVNNAGDIFYYTYEELINNNGTLRMCNAILIKDSVFELTEQGVYKLDKDNNVQSTESILKQYKTYTKAMFLDSAPQADCFGIVTEAYGGNYGVITGFNNDIRAPKIECDTLEIMCRKIKLKASKEDGTTFNVDKLIIYHNSCLKWLFRASDINCKELVLKEDVDDLYTLQLLAFTLSENMREHKNDEAGILEIKANVTVDTDDAMEMVREACKINIGSTGETDKLNSGWQGNAWIDRVTARQMHEEIEQAYKAIYLCKAFAHLVKPIRVKCLDKIRWIVHSMTVTESLLINHSGPDVDWESNVTKVKQITNTCVNLLDRMRSMESNWTTVK